MEHRPTVLSLSCIQTKLQIRGDRTLVSHLSQQSHDKASPWPFTMPSSFLSTFLYRSPYSLLLAETTTPLQLEVLSSMGISWKSWKKHFTTVTRIKSCPFLPLFAYLLLTSQIHGCKGIAQRLTCLASNNWRGIQREYDCQVGHRDTGDNKKKAASTLIWSPPAQPVTSSQSPKQAHETHGFRNTSRNLQVIPLVPVL